MIGRPMSVNSSFDSHGSHNPNFPRDSSFESRYEYDTSKKITILHISAIHWVLSTYRVDNCKLLFSSLQQWNYNWISPEEVVPTQATTATEMTPGMVSETKEATSVITLPGVKWRHNTEIKMYFLYFIRGLAPNFRQDSIRSGYISDHESRSGYEHRGEYDRGGRASGHTIYPCLFQIRTSGTLLTFDKVKLSLSYMTCCACFRSSNKRSPLLVTFPMF